MNRKFLITGAILGLFAIIFGAFAAHGLKNLVDAQAVESFETGVRFQMYHAFLFLLMGFLDPRKLNLQTTYILLLSGTILFSGSIYLLATNTLTPFFDFTTIALLTPLGGTLLIVGWAMILYRFIKMKAK